MEDRNNLSRDLSRPLRLLLVEDNPADAMLVEIGLESTEAAYTLEVAKDGAEAIELLLRIGQNGISAPDLILLDLNLPKVTGQEVLLMIKAQPSLQAIPVIVLSSSSEQSDIMAAYRHGASSYLRKRGSIDETFDLMGTLRHYWVDFALLPANPAVI
jgi:CheY-like chemotaxis protein